MLYLDNITTPQTIDLPLERWNALEVEVDTVTWRAMFDGREIDVAVNVDEASIFGHYMRLTVTLPEGIADGSYELALEIAEPSPLAGRQSYVAQVGDYVAADTQYNHSIEYEQYR